jgi:hypothetical protein
MQSIPVDVSRLRGLICVAAPERKVDVMTGEVRTSRDGNELWVVGVSVRRDGTRKASVIDVTVPAEPKGVGEGSRVMVADLEASGWEVDGRHGIAYRAATIAPAETHPAHPAQPVHPARQAARAGDAA